MEIEKKYENLSALFKRLANPIRLKILEQLSMNCHPDDSQKYCVNDIKTSVDLPQPYVSKHLKIVKKSKILEFERDGNKLYYKFKNDNILRDLKEFLNRFNCCKNYLNYLRNLVGKVELFSPVILARVSSFRSFNQGIISAKIRKVLVNN